MGVGAPTCSISCTEWGLEVVSWDRGQAGTPSLTRFLRSSVVLHSFWLRLPPSSLSPRFKESIQTLGYVDSLQQVHCISPLLYESGHIPFTLSMDNGRTFPHAGTWLAGEPSLCQASLGCYIRTLHPPWALVPICNPRPRDFP